MNKTVDLSVSNYGITRHNNYQLVVLPWGATEPHNYHLPYLTDCILSHDIAVDAAQRLLDVHGLHAMVMPPITMGSQNPGQRALPFCVHTRYETQKAILTDIVDSLYHQGFRKLVIVNGHGGNTFKSMIRDLLTQYPDLLIAASEWFKMCRAKDFFDNPGDHADEIETSVMMHYHPELVNLADAGEAKSNAFTIEALQDGRVWMPRNWKKVSKDTGIGSPSLSTAEKGKRFVSAVCDAYASFFADFIAVNTEDDLYTEDAW